MSWQPKTAQPVNGGTWQPKTAQPVQENPRLNQDLGSQIGAGILAFGQGGMPIFDEAGAAAGAALEKLGSPWPAAVGEPDSSFGQIYDQRLANIRNTEKAFGAEHPVLDPALRVAGGITGAIATPGVAAASAARPVLTGAALGAAQGFSGAEGGFDSRSFNGAIGAGLGGALAYGGKWLGDKLAGLNKGTTVQTPQGNVEVPFEAGGRALKEIRANLNLGGLTPEDYAQRLAASSVDDFAGELGGENLRQLAQSKAKIPGVAMDAARTAMRDRINNANQRVKDIIAQTIASPDDIAIAEARLEGKRALETPLFDLAKEQLHPANMFNDVLATPAGQKAVSASSVNLANRMVEPNQVGMVRDLVKGSDIRLPNGDTVVAELPTDVWHSMAKSLGHQVDKNIAGNIIDAEQAAPIEGLRDMMISRLRQASPEFDKAQTNSAAAFSGEDAMSYGRKLARMMAGDNAEEILQSATRNAYDAPYARAGLAKGLLDIVADSQLNGGNPASRLAKERTGNLAAELVGADQGSAFVNKLLAEKLRMDFANRGLNNSVTAETIGQMVSNVADIPTSTVDVAKKSGNALINLLTKNSDKRAASMLYATKPEEKAALAALLLKTNQPNGFNGMKVLNEAERRALAGLLTKTAPALPAQIGGALVNSGGQ